MNKYLEEIRSWNWPKIVAHAENNTFQEEESINGSCMVGSLLSVPSGKYYMPFACSNVDPCPHCKGDGSVKNLNCDTAKYEVALENVRRARFKAMQDFGAYCNGEWPEGTQAYITVLQIHADGLNPVHTCPFCNGTGSEEAYLDSLWIEALEQVAEENGGWMEFNDDQHFVMNLGNLDDDVLFTDPGFYFQGEVVAETEEELRAWMDEEGYFPNVWAFSDHGQVSAYSWET